MAILLAEICRAYGIKAKHITCMPYEEPFDDCHVVVHAYSERLCQWIMLDPTNHLYLKDKQGNLLDIPKFRQILLDDEVLNINEQASYNGMPFNLEDYREYMTKNIFRFQGSLNYSFGSEDGRNGNRQVLLLPKDYEFKDVNTDDYYKDSIIVRNDKYFWKV